MEKRMEDIEVRDVMMILAGYYACQCENNGGIFDDFGADSIHHCYEYREIIKSIPVPHVPNGRIDTETLRDMIYKSIFNKYLPNVDSDCEE